MAHIDKQRLDWLEEQCGWGLVEDDNGHYALVFDGFQSCPMSDEPQNIQTTFWIEKDKWCSSVREAIDTAMTRVGQGGS